MQRAPLLVLGLLLLAAACETQSGAFISAKPRHYDTDSVETSAHKLGVVQGFYGPESVRYSPDQDQFFVSVMNGFGSNKDNNGYIVTLDAAQLGSGFHWHSPLLPRAAGPGLLVGASGSGMPLERARV